MRKIRNERRDAVPLLALGFAVSGCGAKSTGRAKRGLVRLAVKGFSGFAALTRLPPAKSAATGSAKLNSPTTLTPLLAFGLAACGGGGGGSSAPPANTPPPLMLPDEIPLSLYENHPTNKAVYDATPQGQSAATLTLAEGAADNDLFRLADDGRIFWLASPDYETETDSNGDGAYIIRISHSHNDQGYTDIEVHVHDIEQEITHAQWDAGENVQPRVRYTLAQIEDILPENDFVPLLLSGDAFAMPQSGPLILTWSLITVASPTSQSTALNSQKIIDQQRDIVARAFADWEQYANIKFIEVSDTEHSIGDIRVNISNTASYGGITARSYINIDYTRNEFSLYLHEIGHALGFKHPFDLTTPGGRSYGFPARPEIQHQEQYSVMNYGQQFRSKITPKRY